MKNADEFHLSTGRGSFQSPASGHPGVRTPTRRRTGWAIVLGGLKGSLDMVSAWIWSVAYGFQLLSINVYPTLGYELSKSKLSYIFTIHITA